MSALLDAAGPSLGTKRRKPAPTAQQSAEWFPYPFKTVSTCHVPLTIIEVNKLYLQMYLADILFNSRRLNFSRPQMRAVLEFARQSGAKNVPSLSALQKLQRHLSSCLGNPEERHVSPGGTVFYVNKIAESLKQVSQVPDAIFHPRYS